MFVLDAQVDFVFAFQQKLNVHTNIMRVKENLLMRKIVSTIYTGISTYMSKTFNTKI